MTQRDEEGLVHTGPPAVETGDEPPVRRVIAPGGLKRAATGLFLGMAAGAAIGLVLPRDEGPRRNIWHTDRPRPFDR